MFAPVARTRSRSRALDPRPWQRRFAASAWRRWFLDRHADFWLAELGSAWSTSELRARVVAIVDETPDTRSFVLAPNRHWPGHRAGQFVPVEVEIDGVRVRRCYSISGSAGARGPRSKLLGLVAGSSSASGSSGSSGSRASDPRGAGSKLLVLQGASSSGSGSSGLDSGSSSGLEASRSGSSSASVLGSSGSSASGASRASDPRGAGSKLLGLVLQGASSSTSCSSSLNPWWSGASPASDGAGSKLPGLGSLGGSSWSGSSGLMVSGAQAASGSWDGGLASAPGAGQRITITVKRVAGGRVSNWLHDHLCVGDVVGLGRPAGEFVVTTAEPLLFVAAGSGITPIIGMLRDLEARDALHDVVVIHGARDDRGAIFGRELATMATQHPGLRLLAHRSAGHGRLDALAIARLVPDLAEREIYACGPPGLLDAVAQAAVEAGVANRMHVERFVAPRATRAESAARPRTVVAPRSCDAPAMFVVASRSPNTPAGLVAPRSPNTPAGLVAPRGPNTPAAFVAVAQLRDRRVELDGAGSLLEQLERAGERPPHGCRMGICNTCRCTKRSGSVEDAITGAISSEPDQEIRLCTSFARSDLELAL